MEGSTVAVILKAANERVGFNLKDYFDLAKEEVDKIVRVEELGMVSEAILCHRNAQRILVEVGSNPIHCVSTLGLVGSVLEFGGEGKRRNERKWKKMNWCFPSLGNRRK